MCLRHERMRKERALLNKISLDLLCSFNGEELVLAFRTAHIAKRSAVSDIPSDEGDLIDCMLQYCCLEKSNQNNNEYCKRIGLDFCWSVYSRINEQRVRKTHPCFLISNSDSWERNVHPDSLLVFALSASCHRLALDHREKRQINDY